MIPLVGFLPPRRPAGEGTVAAVEKRPDARTASCTRYDTPTCDDGLPPGEGTFLPCTFWLADNLALQGRRDEARRAVRPTARRCATTWAACRGVRPGGERLLGNFPQAFSHVGLVNTAALNLARPGRRPGRAARKNA